jgi:mitosis inhibitor protein kinase SWE1
LRKSTLQQRHGERTSWGKRHAAALLAAQQMVQNTPAPPETSTPVASRNRPRLSLDQFVAPPPRESPFTSHGNLPNASMHMIHQPAPPPIHQPHPLSRTMTTSSSSSSIPDESPTHVPTQFPLHHQPRKHDFSKSLPAGSLRPFALEPRNDGESGFATPQNYKNVKPLPAAFASTGLISKVNRYPEGPQLARGIGKGQVPDTPCKKQVNIFATYPAPVPGSAIAKARHIRHSFGTPSTPFNPHGTPVPTTFGKGAGVFGGAFGGPSRRGSFLSADGDDNSESPDAKKDSQASTESEFPPTPTKQILTQHQNDGSPSNYRSFPASVSAVGYGLTKRPPRTSSKLNLFTSPDQAGDESDDLMAANDSPTTAVYFRTMQTPESVPSFSRSRTLRALTQHTGAPSIPKSLTTSFINPSSKLGLAKISLVASASPLDRIDFIERLAPRTTHDGMLPPDPSGLSISNLRDGNAAKLSAPTSMLPPATPTTGREYFPMMGDQKLSTTPIGSFAPIEIDDSLASKFDNVEMIGTGEFSRVFKVTQNAQLSKSTSHFEFGTPNSAMHRRSPRTPMPERVYAVKKSRQPFQGTRDRERKLQEVQVLKALGQSDHVVHLFDSWEAKNHLYIQTEFCEEGSLDMFLNEVGRKGRIDDFRIWKILLEISLVSTS